MRSLCHVAAAAIFPLLTKHVTCTTLLQLPVRVASPVPSWVYGEIVWLARPSHLIAGALRAGKLDRPSHSAPRAFKWDGLASQTNGETEPAFLVCDVIITRYGIMADRALDRILPDKRAQDATTLTDFSDSFGISHS